MSCMMKSNNISGVVFLLVILFSMSSWLDVNGVWVEMPVLTALLPEGWNLPSYIVIIIQLANVGPALYFFFRKIRLVDHNLAKNSKVDIDVILSFILILVAGISVLLMSFLWDKTASVFGEQHSVAILSLMIFTALSSCTSSVVFLPYMARFSTLYLSAYYVGQGFSGMVPGLIGLLQGIGDFDCVQGTTNGTFAGNYSYFDVFNFTETTLTNQTKISVVYRDPKFSVEVFFVCLTILFAVSGVSFYLLNFSQLGMKVMVTPKHIKEQHKNLSKKQDLEEIQVVYHVNGAVSHHLLEDQKQLNNTVKLNGATHHLDTDDETTLNKIAENTDEIPNNYVKRTKKPMSQATFVILLLSVGSVAALSNGLLPATQSYTCLPYGSLVYTLALRLSSVSGAFVSLLCMILPKPTTKMVFVLALIGTLIAAFHLLLAAQSPNPILRGHIVGEILVVCYNFITPFQPYIAYSLLHC